MGYVEKRIWGGGGWAGKITEKGKKKNVTTQSEIGDSETWVRVENGV